MFGSTENFLCSSWPRSTRLALIRIASFSYSNRLAIVVSYRTYFLVFCKKTLSLSLLHQLQGVLAISIRDFWISVAMSIESGPSLITWKRRVIFCPTLHRRISPIRRPWTARSPYTRGRSCGWRSTARCRAGSTSARRVRSRPASSRGRHSTPPTRCLRAEPVSQGRRRGTSMRRRGEVEVSLEIVRFHRAWQGSKAPSCLARRWSPWSPRSGFATTWTRTRTAWGWASGTSRPPLLRPRPVIRKIIWLVFLLKTWWRKGNSFDDSKLVIESLMKRAFYRFCFHLFAMSNCHMRLLL